MREELREVSLFRGGRTADVRWIEQHGSVIDLPAGRTVLREGAIARDFVVVLDGVVSMADGEGVSLAGPGSHFGELGLIDGGAHDVTVTTQTPVRLLVFDARTFRGMLHRTPFVSRRLLEGLVARVRRPQPSRSLAAVS